MSDLILIDSIFQLNKSLNSIKAIIELSCEDDPIHDLLVDVYDNFDIRYRNHLKLACSLQSENSDLKRKLQDLT